MKDKKNDRSERETNRGRKTQSKRDRSQRNQRELEDNRNEERRGSNS